MERLVAIERQQMKSGLPPFAAGPDVWRQVHRRAGQLASPSVPALRSARRVAARARLVPLASYDVPGLAALEDRDVKRTTIWTLR